MKTIRFGFDNNLALILCRNITIVTLVENKLEIRLLDGCIHSVVYDTPEQALERYNQIYYYIAG